MLKLRNLVGMDGLIRQGSLPELGIPTWTLAQEAIRAGQKEKALELMELARSEVHKPHHAARELIAAMATYVAENSGEPELEKIWRYAFSDAWRSLTLDTVEDTIRLYMVAQRGMGAGRTGLGDISVVEERDRYVMTLDPCGSGGRLRQAGRFGVTRKAYPWSWGKAGVPYYCTFCCVALEVMPTEAQGYPAQIHENVDQPQGPCLLFYYKKPELIPEQYFTRIGFAKDLARLRPPKV